MVPIPRGSTAYKVAARESAPSGELPSDRHDEPQPVQSPYHLTCGGHRCRSLDRSSPQPSRKKERDIDVELDIERPIQGGQVDEPEALGHDQVRCGVPAGVVELKHDDALASRPASRANSPRSAAKNG